jgi:hypothetical protein
MRESKLTEMLKGISPSEFKSFGEFLYSPFHNKSKKILQLYELINNNFEKFDANVLTNKRIAISIFNDEGSKDQNVRTLISNFTTLLEEFLVQLEISGNTVQSKLFLLKSLSGRNIRKTFNMTSNEITGITSKDFNKNIVFYYDDLTHKDILLNYRGEDLDLDLDKSYFDMADNADCLFIVTKLRVINTVLSRRILSGGNIYKSFWGVDNIIDYVEKNIEKIRKSHPIIYSEYKILKMMLKPDSVKHFHDLEKHVLANISKYSEDELEQVYYSLANYCVNKIATGEDKFITELYKIYTNFEKNGFYKRNNNIQYTDFMSVVICGLNLKEIKWVNYFFENYKSNISSDVKRDTINLVSALISFYNKKYKECINQLNKVGYKYSYFYLKSKETLIKSYYELGETELIESAIDAAKHYLKRHRDILSIHYDRYILFLNGVNNLIKLDKKQKAEIKLLMKKLDENRNTIAREWLIEKIIELR